MLTNKAPQTLHPSATLAHLEQVVWVVVALAPILDFAVAGRHARGATRRRKRQPALARGGSCAPPAPRPSQRRRACGGCAFRQGDS